MRHPERNAAACIKLLNRAGSASIKLPHVELLQTPAQLEARARLVRTVLNTRRMLADLRARADRLAADLDRFKQRRRQIDVA